MLRGALRVFAFMSSLTPCVRVHAHGEPPAAYAIVSHDAQGARAVRLSAGVAFRRGAQRFQFVCPSAWGDRYAAPLAALADATLVVGATSGLMLLSEDGKVRAHPDPAAAGDSSEVVRTAQGVFSLRSTQEGSELLAVDAQRVRTVWKDAKSLYSLAGLDDKLVLLRASELRLEQLTLTADGTELDRQLAVLGSPVDYVFARATAGAAYALVVFRTSSALGTLHMNAFTRIAEGQLSIAGPLSLGGGTLLALDGKLSQLVDGQARPLAEGAYVLCLEQHEGLSYACTPEGITRVSDQALAEPLFRFRWLVAPDPASLEPAEARALCNTQWQDLRFDLLQAGIALGEDVMPDAGSAPVQANNTLIDAEVEGGESSEADDAGSVRVVSSEPRAEEGARCGALPWKTGAARSACVSALVLVFVLLRRRRAR